MFESIMNFFKKLSKKESKASNSKDAAKERLHLVLMQDRANVSADFLELMKQEIIEVIKKYIDIDEKAIDVRLTNKENEDGTNGAPALYANIPIINIKNEARKIDVKDAKNEETEKDKKKDEKKDEKKDIKEEKTEKTNQDNKEQENKQKEIKEKKLQESDKEIKKQEHKEEKTENKENKEIKEIKEENKKEKENDSKEEIKSENKKKSDLN